jgi:CIC family chloride channel protein
MVVLAMLYTRSFYGFAHLFRRLSLARHWRPAVGALLVAALGLLLYALVGDALVLSVLSFGYGVLQRGLDPSAAGLTAGVLLAVALGKIVTTGLTIGSGGSGGVFGPSMVIGGCGGGALGLVLHSWWPALVPDPGSFVVVGMAGFFAAAAKTPFSTLVIVSEMTGDYNLILPTLWVCVLSFLLSDDQSLYRSQVESRSRSPAHQGRFVRDVLSGVTLRPFLKRDWQGPLLKASDPLAAVLERFHESELPTLPVADAEGRLLGVISLEELAVALQADHAEPLLLAADLMRPVKPLGPDDSLDRALELFTENDLLALPVVDAAAGNRVLDVVRRYDISSAYLRRLHAPRPEPTADGDVTSPAAL